MASTLECELQTYWGANVCQYTNGITLHDGNFIRCDSEDLCLSCCPRVGTVYQEVSYLHDDLLRRSLLSVHRAGTHLVQGCNHRITSRIDVVRGPQSPAVPLENVSGSVIPFSMCKCINLRDLRFLRAAVLVLYPHYELVTSCCIRAAYHNIQ